MTEQQIMEQATATAEFFIDNAIEYLGRRFDGLSKEQELKIIELYVTACIADQNTMINNPKRK